VDETGQPGGVTPGGSSNGAGPHEERVDRGGKADSAGQARLNGWAAADAVWSNAGAALEPAPEPVQSSWRTAPGDPGIGHGWADAPRYADLLAPLSPAPQQQPPQPQAGINGADTHQVAHRVPSSAPPYPYEGDLEDEARVPGFSAVNPVPPIALDRPLPPVQAALAPQPDLPRRSAEIARHGAKEDLPARRSVPPPDGAGPGQAPPPVQSVPPVVPPRPSFGPAAPRSSGAPMTPQQWREARDQGKPADVPPGFRPQPQPQHGYDTSLYERPVSPPAPSAPSPPVPQARSSAPVPTRPAATWAQEWPHLDRVPEPTPAEPRTPSRPTDLSSGPLTAPVTPAAPTPLAPTPPLPPAPAQATTSQVAPAASPGRARCADRPGAAR